MELLLHWRTIKKRLWLIVLLAVLAAAGAAYYVQLQVPLYTTTTTLFLNSGVSSPILPWDLRASLQSLADTYVEYMRTRSFAGLVAAELETPLSQGAIVGALSSQLVPDTQFFKIRAVHPDPRQAQALANTAAQVLISENVSRQQAQRQQLESQRDPARALERQRLAELQTALEEEQDYTADRIANLQAQIADLETRPPSEETDQHILDLRGELVTYQSLRVDLFGS
ncbi:Wzz/FepE/Etk N-terminal domain-containing protein, partial [Chloroflexota bacterium]